VSEKTLWRGRPSFWNWWPELALAVLLGCTAGGLAACDRLAAAGVCAASCLAALLAAALKRLRRSYEVTTERVRVQEGWFARTVVETDLCDVRAVDLAQTFFQRLAGMGDVLVYSSIGESAGVNLSGVARAVEVKEIVRKARLAVTPRQPPSPGSIDEQTPA
jgi:uncharacterized membrane protein YdbT with pleckstrin-like domain